MACVYAGAGFAQPYELSAPADTVITRNSITLTWTGGDAFPRICFDSTPADAGQTTNAACRRPLQLNANEVASGFVVPDDVTPGNDGVVAAEFVPGATLYFQITAPGQPPSPIVGYTVSADNNVAVDRAILPPVLRNIVDRVNRGIYQRIVERQREDGRWK